eukprot:7620900-Pyramimonas_sp.AAC.1
MRVTLTRLGFPSGAIPMPTAASMFTVLGMYHPMCPTPRTVQVKGAPANDSFNTSPSYAIQSSYERRAPYASIVH